MIIAPMTEVACASLAAQRPARDRRETESALQAPDERLLHLQRRITELTLANEALSREIGRRDRAAEGSSAGDLSARLAIDDRERTRARLHQGEASLAAEKQMLEMVAKQADLGANLAELCRQAETRLPDSCCSILLADPGADAFRLGAAPSLSESFRGLLDGMAVAADSGPCGLAAIEKSAVIVPDLANERRWSAAAAMVEQGFAGVWSTPIVAGDETVLATFAILRRKRGSPSAEEQEVIDRLTPIVGIAIERARADASLAASEAELRRANRFLNEAQRLSRTGGFTWDVQADEHVWSDEVYRIFGLDPDASVSVALIRSTIHAHDLAEVERAISGAARGEDLDFKFRIVSPEGIKHARVVAHRIAEIIDRPVFVGALQDVTESKLVEETLARARSELAHVGRVAALNTMTASIAHEVSQPLSGILSNASTCLRLLTADPPDVNGAANVARRTLRDANRASEVVNRLRAMFSRHASGNTEQIDLNDVAREVVELSAGELQRSRVRLTSEFTAGLPPISGDRVQLQQVVLNLLVNAADAMAEVEDRPRTIVIRTGLNDRGGGVRLDVRDSGIGVEPGKVEQLFEAFYTTKPQGMGVGLAISRSIIERHDGRLWAEANDGPGVTVSFCIPAPAASGATL
jgi:signal transduction histidine kinase